MIKRDARAPHGEAHIGIGRPLANETIDSIITGVKLLDSADIVFAFRRTPVLSYVSASELIGVTGQTHETADEINDAVIDLIGNLAISGVINPNSFTLDQTVDLHRIKLRPKKHVLAIELKIKDKPSTDYPSGYVLRGEKEAIRTALNLPFQPYNHLAERDLMHEVKLGVINNSVAKRDGTKLRQDMHTCAPSIITFNAVRPTHF